MKIVVALIIIIFLFMITTRRFKNSSLPFASKLMVLFVDVLIAVILVMVVFSMLTGGK